MMSAGQVILTIEAAKCSSTSCTRSVPSAGCNLLAQPSRAGISQGMACNTADSYSGDSLPSSTSSSCTQAGCAGAGFTPLLPWAALEMRFGGGQFGRSLWQGDGKYPKRAMQLLLHPPWGAATLTCSSSRGPTHAGVALLTSLVLTASCLI